MLRAPAGSSASAKAASAPAGWPADKASAPLARSGAGAQPFAGDASPLIANPASVWFAAPGPAPDTWAKPGAAPKQANTPETAAKSQAEASKLGLRRAPSNATAPTGLPLFWTDWPLHYSMFALARGSDMCMRSDLEA